MMANTGFVISNQVLLELLRFLAKPLEYYNKHKEDVIFADIQEGQPSVIKGCGLENYPARNELKGLFDAISINAQDLLNNAANCPKSRFNTAVANISKAQKDIANLKANALTTTQQDSLDNGLHRKFFEGTNTIDAAVINQLTIVLGALKQISPCTTR